MLPQNLKATFITRFDGLWRDRPAQPLLFDVDSDGRPFIALKHTLIALQVADDEPPDSLRIAGVEAIDDFAWMADGRVLLVAGKSLGELSKDGFDPLMPRSFTFISSQARKYAKEIPKCSRCTREWSGRSIWTSG